MKFKPVILALAALFLAAPANADAPSLVADLAEPLVKISYSFSGTKLLVFGAAQCSADSETAPCHLVAVMKGPPEPLVVRRKEKRSGLWVNGKATEYANVPGYYAYASTAPLSDIAPPDLRKTLGLGIEDALAAPPGVTGFTQGLITDRSDKGLYLEEAQSIIVRQGRLFRMSFTAPATVPTGDYTVQIYSIINGQVTAQTQQSLSIRKAGFEAFVTNAARSHPLAYGIASIILALAIGFASATLFER